MFGIEVSRGGWRLLAVLALLAASGCWAPVDRTMAGVPTWGLVAAAAVPLVVHELAHLAAGRLVGLKPLAFEIRGTGLGARLAGDPDDRPAWTRRRRARQQAAVSAAGPLSALPCALAAVAAVGDPAILALLLAACCGSLVQLVPRPGSDGDRLLRALRLLRGAPAGHRVALQLAAG